MEFLAELLIELVLELTLDAGVDAAIDHRHSKWVRYPLIALLVLFFGVITVGLIVFGAFQIRKSTFGGGVIIAVGAILLVMGIVKFRKVLKRVKNT